MVYPRIQPLAMDVVKPEPLNAVDIMISVCSVVKETLNTFIDAINNLATSIREAGLLDNADDYQIRRWINSLPSLGYMDNTHAYLIIFDKAKPSNTRVITEAL